MRPEARLVLLVALAAAGCARPTPVANAPKLDVAASEESLVQAAALAEESRTFQPLDTLWVERKTRDLFDSDSAADAWAQANVPVITRVPAQLLTAYARANVEGGPVVFPRGGVRGHAVAAPRVAPALANFDYQVIVLTRPGFNEARDTAFMMVTRACGNLCGRVDGFLIVREKKSWRVATTAWRSYR